ncbi:hypothetical protein QBC36DRAFT_239079 [Triangularia setosa]|uniref:Uncharacterized protein n=1 Tax=Triangularia setosa TaxID=2587417 RepID=A0AAN6W6N9_9PEZI|nr:hypothetical protein QBC36DRAFT_239079 [Podospora setosa]
MHISRTVLTTIALAATGSALPASSCGSGTCPHRVTGGDNQGTQQGQQGGQRFDKTRQNGDDGLTARSHNLVFAAGHPADSGNQMGGSSNTGLYDKSDNNYLGKKELDHDKIQLSTSPSAVNPNQGLTVGSPLRYSKEQQFQTRSDINSEIRKNNNGQQQQRQGQESGQLMTTLDKIRELLFGPQQQQNLERQQQGKDNSHIRRSEIQGQGSMGSDIQGQAGRFESGRYSQSGQGQERQRLRDGDREQPLQNNLNGKDGLTEGQNQRQRLDHGDGQQSNNGQVQWSVVKGGDYQNPAMREQDVPTIVISQHEKKVQPRGQGQSSSKGSGSSNSEGEEESAKFIQPEQQPMQQQLQQPTSSTRGGLDQLFSKGDNNNQGRLSGRGEHTGIMSNPLAQKNDGASGTSEEEGQDQKVEKVLGSSDQGKQQGQNEAEIQRCLYIAGQQGDISMLRDCFNNDAGKMQNQGQQQQQQRFDGSTGQTQGQLQGGKAQA